MPKLALLLLAGACIAAALACTAPTPTEVPPPTPDVEATVAAGIAATREAETRATQVAEGYKATVEAQVAATLTAVPTPTPTAVPTPTMRPTATPWPTRTPRPTPTPLPVPTDAEIERLISDYYNCLQANEEFKELSWAGVELAFESEGMTEEEAKEMADVFMNNKGFLVMSLREAILMDSSPLEMFQFFQEDLEICEGSIGDGALIAGDLRAYAAQYAGGPGAIYIGDGNWESLAGPSVYPEFMRRHGIDLGNADGNVPLNAIEQHQWIFESDYYQELIRKARLTNPTELVSSGEYIAIRHTCIHRALQWCKHLETYFVTNVAARTNEQVIIEISSFPELRLTGSDAIQSLDNGRLAMAEISGSYLAGEFPTLGMQFISGLWPDHHTHYQAQIAIAPDIDKVITDAAGSKVLMRNWIGGTDQFFFSKKRLSSPDDFAGLKIRSVSADSSNWIDAMGASAQYVEFPMVHNALERGILDAAVTGANAGTLQGWYEVTSFINGPLYFFDSSIIAVNGDVWDSIPADLQQILIEEGAKHELESLRLATIQNLIGLQRSSEAGLEFVEFGPEMRLASFEAAKNQVLPNWLKRLSYRQWNGAVTVFNNKVGPVVGLRVEPDGSVVEIPITQGPHAGKTVAEVLGRR